MIRQAATALIFMMIPVSGIATADDMKPLDPRVEALLDAMPTEQQVDEMMTEMPDITALLGGLMQIASDDDTRATLERVGTKLQNRLDGLDLEADIENGEIPDINGLIGEMMKLPADREMMGDLLGLAFEVKDVIDDAMPEATEQ
jgi:hypothetical protein